MDELMGQTPDEELPSGALMELSDKFIAFAQGLSEDAGILPWPILLENDRATERMLVFRASDWSYVLVMLVVQESRESGAAFRVFDGLVRGRETFLDDVRRCWAKEESAMTLFPELPDDKQMLSKDQLFRELGLDDDE